MNESINQSSIILFHFFMNMPPIQKPQSPALCGKALFYMFLLMLQFGLQPMLTSKFTSRSASKSSIIMVQETLKFVLAMFMLITSGNFSDVVKGELLSKFCVR